LFTTPTGENENCPAASSQTSLNICQRVANHQRLREIDAEAVRQIDEQPGLWLSARASLIRAMRTTRDRLNRSTIPLYLIHHATVQLVDRLARCDPTIDDGLIGHDEHA
jgi:hypothetical protein